MNRNQIKLLLQKNEIVMRFGKYFYSVVKHPNRIMKNRSFGKLNSDKTILIIRPNSEDQVQGLMSLFVQTMRWIEYAERCHYIPYIDFKRYKTQYYNGKDNIWEYYFTQPSSIPEVEVYNSEHVVISGNSLKPNVNNALFRGSVFSNANLCRKCHQIITTNIEFSNEIKEKIAQEELSLHADECIGVYLRGTDYIKLRPAGEYVQPELKDVMEKIDEFLMVHSNNNIFLVTEDNDYYIRLRERYGEKLRIVSFDSFVTNYDGKTFLSKSGCLIDDKKKLGADYLVKIALLAKCKYLISSITMGSIAAYCLNGGIYKEKYIFDLGYYE